MSGAPDSLTRRQKQERTVTPTVSKSERAAAIRRATSRVRARVAIDFVREVRG